MQQTLPSGGAKEQTDFVELLSSLFQPFHWADIVRACDLLAQSAKDALSLAAQGTVQAAGREHAVVLMVAPGLAVDTTARLTDIALIHQKRGMKFQLRIQMQSGSVGGECRDVIDTIEGLCIAPQVRATVLQHREVFALLHF